ncbi:hypothetical protein D3C74_270060 [compost metagenome]
MRRALGYQYDEVTREASKVIDPETNEPKTIMVETKRVTKEVQPETTAAIFWLKNRRPDRWRDKQDIAHQINMVNPFADLTTEELRRLAKG